MAAALLLALKATAYHGEDNNWLVRVDGMIDANKCLRVGSITDLGADEANSNTGDRTTPNSNVTCGFGSAGLAPMCSLSKEAGSGVAEAVAEAQAAITRPASISGCVFDESSATSASVTGFALDTTCYNEFIVQQQTNNQRPGASPDLVYVRTQMPKHTRACLLVGFCSSSGYTLLNNVAAPEAPEFYSSDGLVATLEQGAAGGGKMFDFISYARGPARPPFPPAPPPAPPSPPPGAAKSTYDASTEPGYTYQFVPPGAAGYTLHWVLADAPGVAPEPGAEPEPEPEAAPEPGRRLSEGIFVQILVVGDNPTGWVGVGFSSDGSMIGSDAVICWDGHIEMYGLTSKGTPPGDLISPQPISGASSTVVSGALRCEFTRPLTTPELSVPVTVSADTSMLWARGSQASLSFHSDGHAFYALRFDGQLAGDVGLTPLQESKRSHGALMFVSWGFLIPTGAILAKFYKHRSPIWFHLHRGVQVLGLVLALAGWVIALHELAPFGGADVTTSVRVHGIIGCTVMTIGLLQPLNAVVRPHKGMKHRCAWEILHKGSGWCAIILSIAVISLGIGILADQETVAFPDARYEFFTAYGVSIGVVALLAVVGAADSHYYRVLKPDAPSYSGTTKRLTTKKGAGTKKKPAPVAPGEGTPHHTFEAAGAVEVEQSEIGHSTAIAATSSAAIGIVSQSEVEKREIACEPEV